MPDQVRATSNPVEQFLASHFFSPRNTRSTRKEVDKEADEKVSVDLRPEIFRVFSRVSWAATIVLAVPGQHYVANAYRIGFDGRGARL